MSPSVSTMTRMTSADQSVSEISRGLDSIVSRITVEGNTESIPAPLISIEDVGNVVEKFKMWAADVGVSHAVHNTQSFEYRLQDAPEALNEVLSLLRTLSGAVLDVLAIVSGERESREVRSTVTAYDGDEDELEGDLEDDEISDHRPVKEVEDVLGIASDCVGSLFKVCEITSVFDAISAPALEPEQDERMEAGPQEVQMKDNKPERGDSKEHGQKYNGWWRVLGHREPKPRPVVIALLGIMGAGKTSFAALASNRTDLRTESGVESCTKTLQAISFEQDGQPIVLIDTPGLDNKRQTDTQILKAMKKWLAKKQSAEQYRLDGLIFLHPIALNRIGRMEKRYTRLLQKIVNPDAYNRLVIATTRWDEVGDDRDIGWRELEEAGATVVRLDNNRESAQSIIRHIITSSAISEPVGPLLQLEQ